MAVILASLNGMIPLLFLLPARAAARQVEWHVRDAPIDGAGVSLPLVEPHVAINPWDARHAAVGAIVVAPDRQAGPWRCATFVTRDDGSSWSRHDFAIDRCIDPWVVFADSSTVLFTATEITREGTGDHRFRLAYRRSLDGGRTWSAASDLGRTHEHAQIVRVPGTIDLLIASRRTTGVSASGTHVVWLARSTDGGLTFEPLLEFGPGGDDVMVTGIVARDDEAVLTFRNREHERGPERASSRVVAFDGPAAPPVRIVEPCTTGGENGFAGYPAAAGDGSLVVHACIGPGLEGVLVSRSVDGGRTWEAPVRADGGSPTPHARTPMLAVAGERVAVAWYDRRHDPDHRCQDVYLAVSDDGARTFAAPVRVTEETSCPQNPANGSVASSWPMGGDYGALAPSPDGSFRLVWADSRSGLFALRTSVFRIVER